MDRMCTRCVRGTLSKTRSLASSPTATSTLRLRPQLQSLVNQHRGLHCSQPLLAEDVPASESTERPLVIRRTTSSNTSAPAPKLLIRKTIGDGRQPPQQRSFLRRNPPPASPSQSQAPGQVLRRRNPPMGSAGQGSFLRRSAGPRSGSAASRGPRKSGAARSESGKRNKPSADMGLEAQREAQAKADAFVAEHVLPKKAEPMTYRPEIPSVQSLRAYWPNTAISREGKVASMVQQINNLARHYPGAATTTDLLARRLLKGHLVRFTAEKDKAHVLQYARRMARRTRKAIKNEKLPKEKSPRYPDVRDLDLTSLNKKSNDQAHMVNTNVLGDYGHVAKQKFAFMQNATQQLNNNETYAPASIQRVMARIQALIPSARSAAASTISQPKA